MSLLDRLLRKASAPTDAPLDLPSTADREADWTAPPSLILVPQTGQVWWSKVYRGVDLVGAVWATVDTNARPRAGIVNVGDGDVGFQEDLGPVTLGVYDSRIDPTEFLDRLAETRDGLGSKVIVDDLYLLAPTLDDVRRTLGLPSWG